jgi:hypothetical protein
VDEVPRQPVFIRHCRPLQRAGIDAVLVQQAGAVDVVALRRLQLGQQRLLVLQLEVLQPRPVLGREPVVGDVLGWRR